MILDGPWLAGMSKGVADEVTKHDEFIFGLAQKRMYDELDRGDKLDSKANSLITLSGALAGFFLGVITNQFKALSALPAYESIILLVGVGLLLASIGYGLTATRVRKWEVVPDPKKLIDKYQDAGYLETLHTVAAGMANVQLLAVEVNNEKARCVDMAWNLLLVGLALTFIFVIVVFL
jgi:hypothetical protein